MTLPITYSSTSVPGFRHWIIQMALVYLIRKTLPKGYRVAISTEQDYTEGGQNFQIDVLAKYYKAYKQEMRVLYEVQKVINLPAFQEKMHILCSNQAEIIPLEKAPDTIEELEKWLEDFIRIP